MLPAPVFALIVALIWNIVSVNELYSLLLNPQREVVVIAGNNLHNEALVRVIGLYRLANGIGFIWTMETEL